MLLFYPVNRQKYIRISDSKKVSVIRLTVFRIIQPCCWPPSKMLLVTAWKNQLLPPWKNPFDVHVYY